MAKKSGLGRGLDALINSNVTQNETSSDSDVKIKKGSSTRELNENTVTEIDLKEIKPNSSQPRKSFNDESISELADSIKENGLIQPILVKKIKNGFELIAGERRLKATKKAGLNKIKAIIVDIDERKKAIFSLIENIQREDLNPIDEASAFNTLKENFSLTQEKLAEITGKTREYIANLLRLLNNTPFIIDLLKSGELSMGMGRTLLGIKDEKERDEATKKIIREGLSVRDAENLVKSINFKKEERVENKSSEIQSNVFILDAEEKLKTKYGVNCKIKIKNNHSGKIEFIIKNKEVLESVIEKLLSNQ